MWPMWAAFPSAWRLSERIPAADVEYPWATGNKDTGDDMILVNGWFLMTITAVTLYVQDKLVAALISVAVANVLLLAWTFMVSTRIENMERHHQRAAGGTSRYVYTGPEALRVEMSAFEIAARVAMFPSVQHVVWRRGWKDWLRADRVPEIAFYIPRLRRAFDIRDPHSLADLPGEQAQRRQDEAGAVAS